MNLIVAVSENWGIGRDNDLLFRIPKDMKFFRETTMGKVVVMGRKTLESFPNAKPLPNRTNIVLTSNPDYKADGVTVVNSVDELLNEIKKYNTDDVFVCGGEAVYRLLYGKCNYAYITKVEAYAEATHFFDNIDKKPDWELVEASEKIEDNGYLISFNKYKRG